MSVDVTPGAGGYPSEALGTRDSPQPQAASTRFVVLCDWAERAFILALFVNFACNVFSGLVAHLNVVTGLLIVSETFPVIMILCRGRSSAMSLNPLDWILAFAGTVAPLLITRPGGTVPLLPEAACVAVMLTGLFTQVSAKAVLWRSFGLVAANRGVKVAGPYGIIRHPMYLGYTITHIGYFLSFPSVWTLMCYSVAVSFQVARILREEKVLERDPVYRVYAERVRYRLVPGLF